ncbi:proline racemase [Tetragenococcus halophilus subsp. flandriensis]|uniref:proline racemase family protein n=1 Tax=Tetragenococcus halophilus TaxID=51669 RepID=UPI0023E941B3|nr:proline racemase family protein [Tetragenococcus halophilus]GMA08692.1 proline racemase [Tetragenococcus halophilus subsp. flandriensis]
MGFKRSLDVVQAHCGEPMHVITSGVPTIPGETVYEQLQWMRENDDQVRNLILKEPRGYPAVNCNLIVPAKNPKAAAGYIIMEQNEYCVMSGGNTITVATVLLETGMIPMIEPITEFYLEAAVGLIKIKAECHNGKVTQVTFTNVPAFPVYLDAEIDVPELGKVKVDIAWGGMFYCLIDSQQFPWLKLVPEQGKEIARISALCYQSAREQLEVYHPDFPDIEITGSELHAPTNNSDADWQSVDTVYTADVDLNKPESWTGALDRSACGTGTSALMAVKYAKGELELNKPFRREGLIGTIFTGNALEEVDVHGHKGILPTISGQAWISAFCKYVLEETDPFPNGFTVGDIW